MSRIWAARVTPPTRAILIVIPSQMRSCATAVSAATESIDSSSTIGWGQWRRTTAHSSTVAHGCSSVNSAAAAVRTNVSA